MAIFAGKFQRVVFIVSSGRTGTKALAHHLSKCYDNVYAVHEPTPSWRLRRASSRALSGRISPDVLAQKLAYCRRQTVSQVQKPIYIESNPFLAGFLEAFGDVFDNPLVLHVVRDPRTYVRSALNWGSYNGIKKLASDYFPYWTVKPEHFVNNTDTPWSQMNDRQRAAWYWKTVNTDLNRGEKLLGDRYLRIRFEDLFNRDGSGLRQFADWVGLPWKEDLLASANKENVNASQAKRCPSWKEWPPDEKRQVLHHCRDLMTLYGYAPEKDGVTLP